MMIEDPRLERVESPLSLVEKRFTANAGPGRRLNVIENVGRRFPRLLLLFRWIAADGDRSRIIGIVAAKADSQVEDHQLPGFDLPVARRAAAVARAEILA